MVNLKELLESLGLPVERGIYTGKQKPKAYFTFIRINKSGVINADDTANGSRELYRVNLVCKGDFEELLDRTLKTLREAGAYINNVGTEIYERETGYWQVPINVEILKE